MLCSLGWCERHARTENKNKQEGTSKMLAPALENQTSLFADNMETLLENQQEITVEVQIEIHQFAETLVANLSHKILDLYFQLGIKASHTNEPIHQIFRDYFTATQHANFRRVYS